MRGCVAVINSRARGQRRDCTTATRSYVVVVRSSVLNAKCRLTGLLNDLYVSHDQFVHVIDIVLHDNVIVSLVLF